MTRLAPKRGCLLCDAVTVEAYQAFCARCFNTVPWELRGFVVQAVSGLYAASVDYQRVMARLAAWKASR